MKLQSVTAVFPGPQPFVVKEVLGPVVREIDYDPDLEQAKVSRFDAKDGQTKVIYLNLKNTMWYELGDPVKSAILEVN